MSSIGGGCERARGLCELVIERTSFRDGRGGASPNAGAEHSGGCHFRTALGPLGRRYGVLGQRARMPPVPRHFYDSRRLHSSKSCAILRVMVESRLVVEVAASAPGVRDHKTFAIRPPFDVSHELGLAKAALLYADQVRLVSPLVDQVQQWRRIVAGDVDDLPTMIEYLQPYWEEGYRPLALPSRETAAALAEGFLARVEREQSWMELQRGTSEGLIEIGAVPVLQDQGFHPGTVIGGLIGFLADALDPANREIPMLDASVGAVLKAATSVGVITRPLPPGSREVGVASHYIASIPAFPETSLDVLIDVRRELAGPLARFRSAMAAMVADISEQPADRDFARAADAAYRRVVAPQLAELEELTKAQRLATVLREEVLRSKGETVAKAVIAFAAMGATAWPQVAQAAVGALVAAADVASGAYDRYRQGDERRRANKFLWLYEAERMITKAR